MAPKEQYTLDDFTQYGQTHFPVAFAAISNTHAYNFEKKTYVNKNQEPHQVDMLLVGFYHKRAGGPSVWAYAMGSATYLFSGNRSEEVLTLIPEEHKSRVYYDGQFGLMAGGQDTRGMTPTRKLGQTVVETVVNFLYLLTGRLNYVVNVQKTDMLGNLKFASMNLGPEPVNTKVVKHAVPESFSEVGAQEAVPEVQGLHWASIDSVSRRVSQREDNIDVASPAHPSVDVCAMTPNQAPYARSNRTSLLEHVLKYESQLNAELAQAKQAHQQDVAALRAELATEEQRRRNAKEVTKEWKLKHEEVAKEASEWKRKYESVREKFAKSKERNRRLKDRASIKKEEED